MGNARLGSALETVIKVVETVRYRLQRMTNSLELVVELSKHSGGAHFALEL